MASKHDDIDADVAEDVIDEGVEEVSESSEIESDQEQQEAPPKKKSGGLFYVIVCLVLFAVAFVGVRQFAGQIPGLSSLTGGQQQPALSVSTPVASSQVQTATTSPVATTQAQDPLSQDPLSTSPVPPQPVSSNAADPLAPVAEGQPITSVEQPTIPATLPAAVLIDDPLAAPAAISESAPAAISEAASAEPVVSPAAVVETPVAETSIAETNV